MTKTKLAAIAFCSMIALTAFAAQTWSRQYVGKTPLSFEAPVNIGAGVSEEVEDPKDWVGKMTDFLAETEDIYLQVTIFEAKDKSVGNHKKLATVLNDIIEVFSDETMSTQFTATEAGGTIELVKKGEPKTGAKMELSNTVVNAIDGYPSISTTLNKTEEDGATQLRITLVGDSTTVYSVFGLTGADNAAGIKDLDKVMKSIRYKRGLK